MNFHVRAANPADIPAVAEVLVASWRSTYPGIVPDSVLDSLTAASQSDRLTRILSRPETSMYVGLMDNRVVGYAMGGPERQGDSEYDGELYAIYLLQEVQGQGLGRDLVRAVASDLAEAGFHKVLVWVFAENPSRRFYEKLGGIHVRSGSLNMDGVQVQEVAYGWEDARRLL